MPPPTLFTSPAMKLRYLLAPLSRLARARKALLILPLVAFAACSSTSQSDDTATQSSGTEPSGTLARKALLHNAPPPIKLLNAVGTVGEKVEKNFEKKSDTTTTTTATADTTTPPQASQ